MLMALRLKRDFFTRPTLEVARDLLGSRLIRMDGSQRLGGIIIETEAYIGETDQACHAKAGCTPRTKVMYGPPGHAYVYFIYGMHWCLNVVTENEGFPAAVLIRAILPQDGLDAIAANRRNRPKRNWCNGPAKLCQALGIDGAFNAVDLCVPRTLLFIEHDISVPESGVTIGPRVGLTSVAEPWKSIPWRFQITPSFLSGMLGDTHEHHL